MQSCWELKDTSRPSFSDIVDFLGSHLEYASDYLDLTGIKNRPPTIKSNPVSSDDYPRPRTDSKLDSLTRDPVSVSANDYYVAEY